MTSEQDEELAFAKDLKRTVLGSFQQTFGCLGNAKWMFCKSTKIVFQTNEDS